jgi:hypothetical protein
VSRANEVPRLVGDGALRFARYALPPNRLGYCGPGDDSALLEQAVALAGPGTASDGAGPGDRADPADVVGGLRALAEGFEGAWPYLELIAGANRIDDPLDDRVVAAYWLGGPGLARVGAFAAGNHVEERFRRRAGRWWGEVAAALAPGVEPSHAFHVMVIGPWVGMLRAGRTEAPLTVMDRCRIRRGTVVAVEGDEAVVRTDRVGLHRGRLSVTPLRDRAPDGAVVERVRLGEGGRHPCGAVAVGDVVSVHWDWVCEVLSPAASAAVGRAERLALAAANRALATTRGAGGRGPGVGGTGTAT